MSVNISGCGIDFCQICDWIIFFSIIFGKNINSLLLEGTLTGKTASTGNSSIHYFTSQLHWANKYSQDEKIFIGERKMNIFQYVRQKFPNIENDLSKMCGNFHCTTTFSAYFNSHDDSLKFHASMDFSVIKRFFPTHWK